MTDEMAQHVEPLPDAAAYVLRWPEGREWSERAVSQVRTAWQEANGRKPLLVLGPGVTVGPLGLDDAWRAAEAALPQRDDGGGAWDSSGGVGLSLTRLNRRAYSAEWGAQRVIEDSPVTALRVLASRLVTRDEP